MKIGLAFDLKEAVQKADSGIPDALEEYDSKETIEIIRHSLEMKGHEVIMLGGGDEFLQNIRSGNNIDMVFNIAEGRGTYRSRESQIPAILEMLDIPYTGSDPLTLALCLDKKMAKTLIAAEGVLTPKYQVISDDSEIESGILKKVWFPAIIKPMFEGSSKGIHETALVLDSKAAEKEIKTQLKNYQQPVLVEEYIRGDEVTVGIIGNSEPEVIGIMKIVPRAKTEHFVYSLEVKRDWENLVDYECPVKFDRGTENAIVKSSLKVYETLGCRDFSRIDFRIDRFGNPYFIEINPLPGLGTYSDLIIMGKKMGYSHEDIINMVMEAGLTRNPTLVQCA